MTSASPTSVRAVPIVTVVDHSTKTVSSICSTFTKDGKKTSSTSFVTTLVPTGTRSGPLITVTQYTTTTVSCNKCGSVTKDGKTVAATVSASLVPISTHIAIQTVATSYSTKTVTTSQNTVTKDGKVVTQTSYITTLAPAATRTTYAPVPKDVAAAAAAAAPKTVTQFTTKTLTQAQTTFLRDGKLHTSSTPVTTVVPATVTEWKTNTITTTCTPWTSNGKVITTTVLTTVSPVNYKSEEWSTVTLTSGSTSIIQAIHTAPSLPPIYHENAIAAAAAAANPVQLSSAIDVAAKPSIPGSPDAAKNPDDGIALPLNPMAAHGAPIVKPISTITTTETSITGTKTVKNTRTSTIYSTTTPFGGVVTNDAGMLVPAGVGLGSTASTTCPPSGTNATGTGAWNGTGTGSPIPFAGEARGRMEVLWGSVGLVLVGVVVVWLFL